MRLMESLLVLNVFEGKTDGCVDGSSLKGEGKKKTRGPKPRLSDS